VVARGGGGGGGGTKGGEKGGWVFLLLYKDCIWIDVK
jgi:hypothetical protein